MILAKAERGKAIIFTPVRESMLSLGFCFSLGEAAHEIHGAEWQYTQTAIFLSAVL
jgi:hypothetical protein